MGGRYLKAYRTTKMASGKDGFLYEDDLDVVLAIIDADIFENDEDMESEIVKCIKHLPLEKIVRSNASFVQKFVYPTSLSAGNGSKISHKAARHRKSFITQSKLMIF